MFLYVVNVKRYAMHANSIGANQRFIMIPIKTPKGLGEKKKRNVDKN